MLCQLALVPTQRFEPFPFIAQTLFFNRLFQFLNGATFLFFNGEPCFNTAFEELMAEPDIHFLFLETDVVCALVLLFALDSELAAQFLSAPVR